MGCGEKAPRLGQRVASRVQCVLVSTRPRLPPHQDYSSTSRRSTHSYESRSTENLGLGHAVKVLHEPLAPNLVVFRAASLDCSGCHVRSAGFQADHISDLDRWCVLFRHAYSIPEDSLRLLD